MKKRLVKASIASLVAALLLLIAIFATITLEVTPDCRVKLVDQSGNPKAGVEIFESWQHYSYDGIVDPWNGEERKVSDGSGIVAFTRKTITITPLDWIKSRLMILENILNVHASFGPDAHIITVNYTSEGVLYDEILTAHDENRVIEIVLDE